MMGWQEEAIERLTALTDYGSNTPDYGTNKGMGYFVGWRTQAICALESIVGEDNIYTKQFEKYANYNNGPDGGIELLRRLISDIQNGYLRRTINIISAEVFGDLLEMAEHLLGQGYKDPAASLTGAVLEDGLRRMAGNVKINVAAKDDLNRLRDKLYDKKVIDRLERKEIDTWSTIRNSADHGKFDEYDQGQVGRMIEGIRSFLGRHLAEPLRDGL